MNNFLNEYCGFGFELNIELSHFWLDSMKKCIFKCIGQG